MDSQERHRFSQEDHTPETVLMTLQEFLESDLEGYEYVNGELEFMPPKSLELGGISTNVVLSLGLYVRENQIGKIYLPYTTFKVGECGLIPDVAFLSNANVPNNFCKASPVPPDLAVEIVSQTDTSYQVEEKAFAYLEAGTQLVWVLNPVSKTVTVYRSETDITLLTRNDTLTGEEVVKGFSCQVAKLFE